MAGATEYSDGMRRVVRTPAHVPRYATGAMVGGGLMLAAQAAWVVGRPLPWYSDLDASGREGREDGVPLTIAVLGDSTCTGPSLDEPSQIWVRSLARMIGDRFAVEIRSVAVGGARAADVARRQLEPAMALAPDIAIVSVGGNDALRGVPYRTFERHLDAIVSGLAEVSGMVMLSGVGDLGSIPRLPQPLRGVCRRRGRVMNLIHQRVGRRHGAVVADQWAWAAGEFNRHPELFCPDLFHPGPAGHEVWARVAFETLNPHLDAWERVPRVEEGL